MIIDLPSTTTSAINKKLIELRERGGAVALGRVLTMVIVTDDGSGAESAIDAANDASREHPCRVIVLARGARRAAQRLDAQIRVGGDAGASEVIVLRMYGPLADQGAAITVPFLLPDAPVVAWWPGEPPEVPGDDPVGRLATRRVTDAAAARNPLKALNARRLSHQAGDTDLAWTRVTLWRGLLAAALDQPPHEAVTRVVVTGAAESPSTDMLAAWLAACLKAPVTRAKSDTGKGIELVRLERRTGDVTLFRPDGNTGELTQPGQPKRRVALQRRPLRDCLSEEMRRLDPDEIYAMALEALPEVRRGRAPAPRDQSPTRTARAARTATPPKETRTTPAEQAAKRGSRSTATSGSATSGSATSGSTRSRPAKSATSSAATSGSAAKSGTTAKTGTAAKSGTAKSSTAKSSTAKSSTAKSSTAKSGAAKSGTAKAGTARSGAAKSGGTSGSARSGAASSRRTASS